MDEAGRGAMAGPVVAAAVILNERWPVAGLADSKTLSPEKREVLAARIRERALAWAVAEASVVEIERINIRQASLLAMSRALSRLFPVPDVVLVDGRDRPSFDAEIIPIIGGDRSHPVISAASILAKVERDRLMCLLHERYPVYQFRRHKGYVTAEHRAALNRHGPSRVHRRGYSPVRRVLAGEDA